MKVNAKILGEYETWMKLEGNKPRTIGERLMRVRRLFEYCEEYSIDVESMKPRQAQEFQGWLINSRTKTGSKYSSGTVLNYIEMATNFYEFLKGVKKIPANPFTEIIRIRPGYRLPRHVLKEDEMSEVLAKLKNFSELPGMYAKIRSYRAHVAAELLYSTGMRIGEAASLSVRDIDFDAGIVRIDETKEGKPRIAFLNDYARRVLFLYVNTMRKYLRRKVGMQQKLFGTRTAHLKYLVNRELARVCKDLGFPAITSHGFRHALGFHLLRAGCNIRYIQEILGHVKLRTTEVYTKIDKDDLRSVMDKYHPRSLSRKNDE
jgi:integrase/recombinase XerD